MAHGLEAPRGFGLTVEQATKPKLGGGCRCVAALRVGGRGRERVLYAVAVRRRLGLPCVDPIIF